LSDGVKVRCPALISSQAVGLSQNTTGKPNELAITGEPGLIIAPVATLLASVCLLVLGNGLFGTLVVVRAGLEGFRSEAIGAMMSSYFAGFGLGALLLPGLISRVGHIRAFAGFAAIASALTLLHLLFLNAWAWMLLRALSGAVYAGMNMVTESWLNAHALAATRGRLLGLYGVLTMGAWALAQGLLNLAPPGDITLFLLVSILIALALAPVTLLPSLPPVVRPEAWFDPRSLFTLSPPAAIGAFLSGFSLSAYWGMGPNFAQSMGFGTAGISAFMAAFLLGAMVLQSPLGWCSDRFPRRLVIAFASLGSALAGLGLAFISNTAPPILLALGFLFGGFGIPLYTLCVAHANDRVNAEDTLATARGMLLLNGVGAILGPLCVGFVMHAFGIRALFVPASAALIALALVALFRRVHGPAESAAPSPLPYAPQISGYLPFEVGSHRNASLRRSRSKGDRSES
jgi:MFS family permease